ncbi:ubiquitin-conjugating enzyme E2 6 [Stemphylium lycopersici]|nr:ubiquitin-conjugating enzyme E2 6 [Stemphylium lycopersici]
MATPGATKRLTREYASISKSPPPYITAHPSDRNILEWHYIITGPPDTPYEGGQYWGTLNFPPDYPFAPPAIRMHTPSGRFQPSSRLCLSISDFHPKSFNPAWEVSTILTGLLSFMTSDEITTGSVRASDAERKLFAQRTRWWNSTCGGTKTAASGNAAAGQRGNIVAGDGGAKFRHEWPDVEEENIKWMKEKNIDLATGLPRPKPTPAQQPACSPDVSGLRRRPGTSATVVQDAAQIARDAGQGWLSRNKWRVFFGCVMLYIMIARVLGDGAVTSSASTATPVNPRRLARVYKSVNIRAKVWLAMLDTTKSIPSLTKEAGGVGDDHRVAADLEKPETVTQAIKISGAKRAFIYLVHHASDHLHGAEFEQDNIAPSDVGRTACNVIVSGAKNGQKIMYLYGPEMLSLHESIVRIGKAPHKDVKITNLGPEEMYKGHLGFGMLSSFVDYMVKNMGIKGPDNGNGEQFPYYEERVRNVSLYTGKPPRRLEAWVRLNKAVFDA